LKFKLREKSVRKAHILFISALMVIFSAIVSTFL